MEWATVIYWVLGLLSAAGVGGWIKKQFDWKKMAGEATKWYNVAMEVKAVAEKARKYADDGYSKEEIHELWNDVMDIFDREDA